MCGVSGTGPIPTMRQITTDGIVKMLIQEIPDPHPILAGGLAHFDGLPVRTSGDP
jgi:hypothetical protein